MITFIHGDDTASSRNYFLEQKRKFKNHQLACRDYFGERHFCNSISVAGVPIRSAKNMDEHEQGWPAAKNFFKDTS